MPFALAALCLAFAGCENETYSDPAMGVKALYIYPGMSYRVPLSGGSGDYAVECNDPQIAELSVDYYGANGGCELLVEACEQGLGSGIITVTDTRSGKTVQCYLEVSDRYHSGRGIMAQNHVVDAYLNEEIEADLRSTLLPKGSTIFFDPRPNHDAYGAGHWFVTVTNDKNIITDTLLRATFTSVPLNVKRLPDAYNALPITRPIFAATRFYVDMPDGSRRTYDEFLIQSLHNDYYFDNFYYEDLTEYYREKYPDAGVRRVVNTYSNIDNRQ